MKTSGKSEEELRKAARPKKFPTGWHDGEIEDAQETTSQNNNDMFRCTVSFFDRDGEKWSLTTFLLDTPKTGLVLRHACAARGVLEKFEAGAVEASDLPGPCRVKVGIEKRKGWPDRLKVEDFAPPSSSSVVNLRAAVKALVLLSGVSLVGLLGACSNIPVQPSEPTAFRYYDYNYEQRRFYPQEQYAGSPAYAPGPNYAANGGSFDPSRPSASSHLGDMALGGAVGAVGGMMMGNHGAGTAATLGEGAGAVAGGEGAAAGAGEAGAVARGALGAAEAGEAAAAVGEVEEGTVIIEILEGLALL